MQREYKKCEHFVRRYDSGYIWPHISQKKLNSQRWRCYLFDTPYLAINRPFAIVSHVINSL